MKTRHPRITATTSSPVGHPLQDEDPSSDPAVIKLRVDKPSHWDWELTTSADTLPVVQFLDKDGRLLVETTGRTAQRARGSFRDGLKVHEKFPRDEPREKPAEPTPPSGNRNFDGFSSKYGSIEAGYRPRKSRSDASLASKDKMDKRIKKRHSSGMDKALRQLEEAAEVEGRRATSPNKRYLVGDFLRKQIVDDLRSPETVGRKTAEEIAKERCEKVMAYLEVRDDSQGEPQAKVPRDAKLNQIKDYISSKRKNEARQTEETSRESLAKIKEYLQGKIKEKMDEERSRSTVETKLNEIRKRYSDHVQHDRRNYRTRKVRSEANIRFDPDVNAREVRTRSNDKRELEERRRSLRTLRSDTVEDPGRVLPAAAEVRKRNSSASSERRKVYRKTKSDVLLNTIETSVESDQKDIGNPPRRIKSQDNLERSWREYKERKRSERLRKNSENRGQEAVEEEDFMTKPRWKDFEHTLCGLRNCRVCENRAMDQVEPQVVDSRPKASNQLETDGKVVELQENYILLDRENRKTENALELPINEAKVGKDGQGVSVVNSPDYGYNSMQKNTIAEYKDMCANSNVKKSDTFRIVDGSERSLAVKKVALTPQSNEDITRDYFKRVYSLLKQRQEDARRFAGPGDPQRLEDTSSSNFCEPAQRRRRRRRRKDPPTPATQGRNKKFFTLS